jgi:hypothetical protein
LFPSFDFDFDLDLKSATSELIFLFKC